MKIKTFEEYQEANPQPPTKTAIASILNDLPADRRDAVDKTIQMVCGYYFNEGVIETLASSKSSMDGFKAKFGDFLKRDTSPKGGLSQ